MTEGSIIDSTLCWLREEINLDERETAKLTIVIFVGIDSRLRNLGG